MTLIRDSLLSKEKERETWVMSRCALAALAPSLGIRCFESEPCTRRQKERNGINSVIRILKVLRMLIDGPRLKDKPRVKAAMGAGHGSRANKRPSTFGVDGEVETSCQLKPVSRKRIRDGGKDDDQVPTM